MSLHIRLRLPASIAIAGCLFVIGAFQANAVAQETEYKSDPIADKFIRPDPSKYDRTKKSDKDEFSKLDREARNALSKYKTAARNALRGSANFNALKSDFDEYYNGYIFPRMAQTSQRYLSVLGDNRDELFKDIETTGNGSQIRNYLIDELVFKNFSRIALDEGYKPEVRLNAILIVGRLDRSKAVRGTSPPRPYDPAVPVLINIASDDAQPSFARIGALSGLLRHANIDGQIPAGVMDVTQRSRLTDLAISLADATFDESFDDVKYWMSRQATQILGALRRPGDGGKVANVLKKLIENEATPTWLAYDAVSAYGDIRFENEAQADAAAMSKSIANVVKRSLLKSNESIDAYIAEIYQNKLIHKKSLEVKSDNVSGAADGDVGENIGSTGGGMTKGAGGGAKGPTSKKNAADGPTFPSYRVDAIQQQIKAQLYSARHALNGKPPRTRRAAASAVASNLNSFASGETSDKINQIVSILDRTMREADLEDSGAVNFGAKKDLATHARLKSIFAKAADDLDSVTVAKDAASALLGETPGE